MNQTDNSADEKIPKINYYGFLFVCFGAGNLLCFHLLINVPGAIVAVFRVFILILLLGLITTFSKNWRKIDKEDWLPMIVGGLLSF